MATGSSFDSAEKGTPKRVPRRILHFSNGTVEEYSTDEEDEAAACRQTTSAKLVDPKTLPWGPWCINRSKTLLSRTLDVIDYCGEKIAWTLGITSPKYQYAIDEYYRVKAEEEEIAKEVEEYNRSMNNSKNDPVVRVRDPNSVRRKSATLEKSDYESLDLPRSDPFLTQPSASTVSTPKPIKQTDSKTTSRNENNDAVKPESKEAPALAVPLAVAVPTDQPEKVVNSTAAPQPSPVLNSDGNADTFELIGDAEDVASPTAVNVAFESEAGGA